MERKRVLRRHNHWSREIEAFKTSGERYSNNCWFAMFLTATSGALDFAMPGIEICNAESSNMRGRICPGRELLLLDR